MILGTIILLATKGDKDTYPSFFQLKKKFPNAHTHVFSGSGGHHYIFLHPEKYTNTLEALLQKTD